MAVLSKNNKGLVVFRVCLGCLKISEKCLKWLIMLSNFKLMLRISSLKRKIVER